MSISIKTTPTFRKEFKKLRKKSNTLSLSVQQLKEILQEDPCFGVPLGKSFFKIRLSSDYSGKSGGYRVITYYKKGSVIILSSIYQKSQQSTISVQKLQEIIKDSV